jgi:hypothetical protein
MSQKPSEMPLFAKTTDFLCWLVPLTNHFPKLHRHTITRRLLDAALDFQEALLEANSRRGQERFSRLTDADACLDKVRLYLRLANRWQWINMGQYEHAGRMLAEMGRLLGGWSKITKRMASPRPEEAGGAGTG